MKRKLLLAMLCIAGALGFKANAQETPENNGVYYMYNKESGLFLTRGEGWGTQAAAKPVGLPWKVSLADGKYTLRMYDITVAGGTGGFGSNGYTDNGSPLAFTPIAGNDGGFKLQNGDNYITCPATAGVVTLSTTQSEWQFLTQAQYDEILAAKVATQEAAIAASMEITIPSGKTLNDVVSDADNWAASAEVNDGVPTSETWTATKHKDRAGNTNWGAYGTEMYQCGNAHYTRTISGLKKGIYKVSIRGMKRIASNANCVTMSNAGWKMSDSYVSANGYIIRFKAWSEDRASDTNPNSTGDFVAIVNNGGYTTEGFVYVGDDGNLVLDASSEAYWGGCWFLFNGVSYTYYSNEVTPEDAAALIAQIPEGKMNNDVQTNLTNAKTAFEGATTIANYNALQTAISAANTSIENYEEAKAAIDAAAKLDEAGKALYNSNEKVLEIKSAYDAGTLVEVADEDLALMEKAFLTAVKAQVTPGSDMSILMESAPYTCPQGNGPGKYKEVYTETYSETAYQPGKVIYQKIEGLTPGVTYEVKFLAVPNVAWKEFPTGDGIAQAYANDATYDITVIAQTGCTPTDYECTLNAVVGEDGVLEFGIQNIAEGGNWYVEKGVGLKYLGIINPINIALGMQNGAVEGPTSAVAGEKVTLTVTPAEGYELENLTITCVNSENEINYDITDYSFTMPAEPVYVIATFQFVPVDKTNLITNWDFTGCENNNFPGWTIYAPNGGNTWKNGTSNVEYWIGTAANGVFDYYQEIEIPDGKYTLTASMWNSTNGVAGDAVNGNAGVYGTSSGVTVFAGVTDDCDNANLHQYTTETLNVLDGKLRLGVKNNGVMGARWFGVDWIKLAQIGEVQTSDYEAGFNVALANAQKAEKDLDNLIPDAALQRLSGVISDMETGVFTEVDEYKAAISALNTAIVVANSYVEPYAVWKKTAPIAEAVGVELADISNMTSDELAAAAQDLYVQMYNYTTANLTDDSALLGAWTNAPGTNKGESWDGTGSDTYLDAWNKDPFAMTQTVTLPAGKYVLMVKARASAGAGIDMTDGVTTIDMPKNGSVGLGIQTDGTPSYSSNGVFANDNKGRGWEYRFLPFESDGETATTLTFNWNTSGQQWIGLDDIQLYGPKMYDITVVPSENGSLNLPAKAAAGETIEIASTPAEGYELATVMITGVNTNIAVPVDVDEWTGELSFTMPEDDVTVTATFQEAYVKLSDYAVTVNPEFVYDPEFGDEIVATITYSSDIKGSYAESFSLNAQFDYEVKDASGNVVATGTKNPLNVSDNTVTAYIDGLAANTTYTINITGVEVTDFDLATFESVVVFKEVIGLDGNPLATATFTTVKPFIAELNVERYVGQGYTSTVAEVDFSAAEEYLGVNGITSDMIRIVNPDETTISDYAPYDGWFATDGTATTWIDLNATEPKSPGICVKFFQAINEGKYEICDMNGADVVDNTYTVRWAIEANDKVAFFNINVKFVEQPVIYLADYTQEGETVDVNIYANTGNVTFDGADSEAFQESAVSTLIGEDWEDVYGVGAKVDNKETMTDNYSCDPAPGFWCLADGTADQWANSTFGVSLIWDDSFSTFNFRAWTKGDISDVLSTTFYLVNNNTKKYVAYRVILNTVPTGIDATPAADGVKPDGKYFENGKIVIYKNGNKYDVSGAPLNK